MTQWIDTVANTATLTNYSTNTPKEGVYWRGKHSATDWDAYLRNDPERKTPDEKGVYEDLPYTQGSEDFSLMYGERFFKLRTIVYEFLITNVKYSQRKGIQLNF